VKTQRTAVILAGSEGLGLAAAQCLGEEGHRVVIFSRSKEKLEAARTCFIKRGHDALIFPGDLASSDDLERLFGFVEERFGGTDILVNNTGGPQPGNILDLPDEAWRTAFEEQAISLMRAIRRVVPGMRARRWGRIITIASLSVKAPIEGLDLSNFMRGGLAAVHRTLARALAPHDVNVHMVLPGSIMTARSRALIQKRADTLKTSFDEALSTSIGRIPKGRLGTPEDVGHVVAFLASERAGYLTGNFIRVDGGMYAGLD
jgi:3-oxoacyl-[acyl-carrier protein] reductase